MGTRIDIPADPVRAGGPRSPPAAGTPGGARAVGVARRSAGSEGRRWLDAAAELAPLLLSGAAVQPHALITRLAAAAAGADFATLAVPHGADQIIVAGVTGELAAGMMNQIEALADSLAGHAIRTGKPSLVTGARREPVAAALGAATGPLIVVPLAVGEQVRGALLLGRLAARPGLTEADLDMAAAFAGHAAVAMEFARARADQITLAQAEDHDRIASDLHDHVIQELFALGMRMQGHAARCDPAAAERVNGYADTVDEIVSKIRTSIFGLHQPRHAPAGLPARVIEIVDEHTAQLGFTAGVRFAGPLDPGPDEALAHDILAVTREALSNCARHARATAVTISLVLQDELITLDITDNGHGLGTPARSSGLSSMRRRAERNGGTFQLTTPATGGTHLTWTARPHPADRTPAAAAAPRRERRSQPASPVPTGSATLTEAPSACSPPVPVARWVPGNKVSGCSCRPIVSTLGSSQNAARTPSP